jgi:hypothetical protein
VRMASLWNVSTSVDALPPLLLLDDPPLVELPPEEPPPEALLPEELPLEEVAPEEAPLEAPLLELPELLEEEPPLLLLEEPAAAGPAMTP